MIKILVVGPGLIGRRHCEEIIKSSRCELVGVVRKQVRDFQLEKKKIKFFLNLQLAINQTKPDAIIIASPNNLHAEHAKICLKNKIPILIEKPLSMNLKNAYEIFKISSENKIPVLVGHHRTHSEGIQKLKNFLDSGTIGEVQTFMGMATFYKPKSYFEAGLWRSKKGGGPIKINLIHEIGIIRYLISEIESIKFVTSNSYRMTEVEDKASFSIKFTNGAIGSIVISDASASPYSWENTSGENKIYPMYQEGCYFITGTRGSISYPNGNFYKAHREPNWEEKMKFQKIDFSSNDPIATQLDHFIDVVEKSVSPKVSALDGYRNMEIILNAI